MRHFFYIALLTFYAISAFAANYPPTDHLIIGTAKYVVDGDTLDVDNRRIRLWGINTPERKQLGYQDAKDYLKKLTVDAKLTCKAFYYDKWKRTVASCEIEGQDIGRLMVLSGMAIDYKKYSKGFYADDETTARLAKRGLWNETP